MPYAERRALCQMVFSGKLTDGRRMGVWISWSADGKKWRYTLAGHLIAGSGPFGKGCFLFSSHPQHQKALVSKNAQRWL